MLALLGSKIKGKFVSFSTRLCFQICTLLMQRVNPHSYRLTNNSVKMSCMLMDLEQPIVLRVRRFIRVRKVRCCRSICCVLRLLGPLERESEDSAPNSRGFDG